MRWSAQGVRARGWVPFHGRSLRVAAPTGARSASAGLPVGEPLPVAIDARSRRLVSALAAALAMVACGDHRTLPVLAEIPQFELTGQTDRPFDSRSLDGHIWVANFIYTSCPGPCPMMTHHMRTIQDATAKSAGVQLVSFTVDPDHDTPAVLAQYAAQFKADPARWHFLTGPMERLNALGQEWFKLNRVDGKLDHSTRFALVDKKRRVRGYYLSGEENFPKDLLKDLMLLEREESSREAAVRAPVKVRG
jgi:protein SCO1